MPSIEIEGVTWETTVRGKMEVTLDDGNVVEHQFMRCAIPKASTKDETAYIEFDVDRMPQHVYEEALQIGFKHLLVTSKAMSAIKGEKTERSRKDAIEAAAAKLEALYRGEIRVTGGKIKIAGAVKTLAMQNARILVKESMKRNGLVPSHYKMSEISAAALIILQGPKGPKLIKAAQEEIARREAEAAEDLGIDVMAMQADPEKVAKAKKPKKVAKPKLDVAQLAAQVQGVQATRRPQH